MTNAWRSGIVESLSRNWHILLMAQRWKQVLQMLVLCGTSDVASSKTTPIFFADGAAHTMSLWIQTEFRVGLGRRVDEITNNSCVILYNCVISLPGICPPSPLFSCLRSLDSFSIDNEYNYKNEILPLTVMRMSFAQNTCSTHSGNSFHNNISSKTRSARNEFLKGKVYLL